MSNLDYKTNLIVCIFNKAEEHNFSSQARKMVQQVVAILLITCSKLGFKQSKQEPIYLNKYPLILQIIRGMTPNYVFLLISAYSMSCGGQGSRLY